MFPDLLDTLLLISLFGVDGQHQFLFSQLRLQMSLRIGEIVHIQQSTILLPPLPQILHLSLILESAFRIFIRIRLPINSLEFVQGFARVKFCDVFLLFGHLDIDEIHV